MTKENKFKIGLCLQEIALSMDDATLERNRERLKLIEDIIAREQEPCEDCISRQYLLDNCVVDRVSMPYVPINRIENAPPVKPQEQKKGQWEFIGNDCCECTACGEVYTSDQFNAINNYYDSRFPKGCPNCGADMRGEI